MNDKDRATIKATNSSYGLSLVLPSDEDIWHKAQKQARRDFFKALRIAGIHFGYMYRLGTGTKVYRLVYNSETIYAMLKSEYAFKLLTGRER